MNRQQCIAVFCVAFILSVIVTPQAARADSEVRLPRIFSDNMVLQQGASVSIWGWGEDGTTVTVKFRDQTVTALVAGGKWIVRLHDLKAGGPDTLTITAGNKIEIKNVLVGEVWLAGGQSNMEFPLSRSFEASNDIAAAANPMIRLIRVNHVRLDEPTNDINTRWSEASPESAAKISAVGYYCIRALQAKMHVPFGLIESDWGGTPAESWMESGFLHATSDGAQIYREWALGEEHYGQQLAQYQKKKQAAQENNTAFTAPAPRKPWRPAELYNGMIAPLVPYAIRGALWYQGEANASSLPRAAQYHKLFPDLIRDWRSLWNEGAFPFLLVQLAPFDVDHDNDDAWPSVREAQLLATKVLPNVGMAVITDIGAEHDVHPTHKKPVGERLALTARAIAYHEPIEFSGPIYKKMKIQGSKIILTFDHLGGGLVAKDGDLIGFSIAGADGKFVGALADIKGDTVVVHSPLVPDPVAARYGWSKFPVVNLWNKAGLPASPFRTDDY